MSINAVGNVVATAPTVPNFYADESDSLIKLLLEPDCIPSSCYPLVIRGKSCVGKTLLGLTALHRLISNDFDQDKICTFTGDDYCRRHSSAMQDQVLDEFKQMFDDADLLMIDDVQHACRFPHAQKELARVIDQRNEDAKPTILVLQDDSVEFEKLDPFLKSRIDAGLNIHIKLPGFAARRHLIDSIAVQLGLQLPDKQIENLARLARVNVVHLKTILTFIGPALSDETCNLSSVADISRLFGLGKDVIDLLADKVIDQVSQQYELTKTALCGRKRSSTVVAARGMAIVLLRNHFEISWSRIGQLLGGRDHSTVINGFRKTSKLIESDPANAENYKAFSRNILLSQLDYTENIPQQAKRVQESVIPIVPR